MEAIINALKIIPAIIRCAKEIEDELPIPQAGKDKMDLVLGMLSALVADVPVEKVKGAFNFAVSILNKLGVFKKTA